MSLEQSIQELTAAIKENNKLLRKANEPIITGIDWNDPNLRTMLKPRLTDFNSEGKMSKKITPNQPSKKLYDETPPLGKGVKKQYTSVRIIPTGKFGDIKVEKVTNGIATLRVSKRTPAQKKELGQIKKQIKNLVKKKKA